MTQRSDNPADPFKKALAEATRTMADEPELTVTYSVDPPGMTGDTMRLPQVSRRLTRDEVLIARGTDEQQFSPGLFRAETFLDSQFGVDEFWAYGNVPVHQMPDTQGRDPMRCPEVRGTIELRRFSACTQGGVGPAQNISFGMNVRFHLSESRAIAGLPSGAVLSSRILDGFGVVSPSAIPLLTGYGLSRPTLASCVIQFDVQAAHR